MNNSEQHHNHLEESTELDEKFIVFTLGDELFAVSARKITEVAQPLDITPLPRLPEWIYGITNLRGEIVSVLNFPKLLQKTSTINFKRTKLIVVREYNSLLAIAANRLNEITVLPQNSIQPNKEESSFLYATASFDSKNINLIDTSKLFSHLTQFPV